MDRISVESRVSFTGIVPGWKANLVSIKTFPYSDLPNNRSLSLEGMIELRVNDTLLLGEELLGSGYIDQYWDELHDFIEPLIAFHPAKWLLSGKRAHLWCEVSPGTRRGTLHLMVDHQSRVAEAIHVPSLVEGLLAAATEWYEWLPKKRRFDYPSQIERLKAAPAPWRK